MACLVSPLYKEGRYGDISIMVIIVADDLGGMQLLLILPIFVVVAT